MNRLTDDFGGLSRRHLLKVGTALAGGASIIDVKEPDHGSLGLAPWSVWRDVHTVVSTAAPISVALGELPDWLAPPCPVPPLAGVGRHFVLQGGPCRNWRELAKGLASSAVAAGRQQRPGVDCRDLCRLAKRSSA